MFEFSGTSEALELNAVPTEEMVAIVGSVGSGPLGRIRQSQQGMTSKRL